MMHRISGGDSEEKRLIARAATGDSRAVVELYDRHAPRLYGLALAICECSTRAQGVLEGLFRSLAAGDLEVGGPIEASAWLALHVRTRALAVVRADGGTSEARARRSGVCRETAGLARLPDAERQVVELAFFRGLSVAEIARLLDETDETICGVLRTAMVTLREQMRGAEPARLPVLMSP